MRSSSSKFPITISVHVVGRNGKATLNAASVLSTYLQRCTALAKLCFKRALKIGKNASSLSCNLKKPLAKYGLRVNRASVFTSTTRLSRKLNLWLMTWFAKFLNSVVHFMYDQDHLLWTRFIAAMLSMMCWGFELPNLKELCVVYP